MGEKISHAGIVERIDGDRITVLISQGSACGSCQLAGHCNASEMKVKRVTALLRNGRSCKVGEAVTVSTDLRTGYRAVAVGFGFPLVLMIAVMVIVMFLTGSESWAALLALASLIPYYLVVYLLRGRISRRVTFEVDG